MKRRGPSRILLAIVVVALLSGLSPVASAQIRAGEAKASASVASIVPAVGGLDLAARVGASAAEVANKIARAQAQAIDLGLLELVLTAEGCTGTRPLEPSQVPQPTRIDNRRGDASATSEEIGGGLGREDARVTTQPLAHAIASGSHLDLAPLLSISGGRAETKSQLIDGTVYEARASVSATLDIAGVFKLSGLRWNALHRTGDKKALEGSFTVSDASSAGQSFDTTQLDELTKTINSALLPTGIAIEFPKVQKLKEPIELVRVTPLRIIFKDSQLGAQLISPLLEATGAERSEIFNQITAIACQLSSILFAGDVGLTIASGSGSLAVQIGGVQAYADDTVSDNPFAGLPEAPLGIGPATGTPDFTTTTPGSPGSTTPGQTLTSAPSGSEGCESVHPFHWPPCSRGAPWLVGLLGLAGVGTMAGLDWRHQRRVRARRLETEPSA